MFKTSECAWAQCSIKLLGRTIVGLRGFEFKKGVEKEHLYGAGDEPIDIQTGNKKPEGSLKLLKYEVDLLNDAAQAAGYDDITEVPHTLILITANFKKSPTDALRTVEAIGVAFSEAGYAQEQNAKMTEVMLPFICMKVRVSKAS
jgi:hypothetical protein